MNITATKNCNTFSKSKKQLRLGFTDYPRKCRYLISQGISNLNFLVLL